LRDPDGAPDVGFWRAFGPSGVDRQHGERALPGSCGPFQASEMAVSGSL